MMAWMTFGPITLEALFERPNNPKNWKHNHLSPRRRQWYIEYTYHVVETGRAQFSHHRLGEGIIRGLEQSTYDVICPV